MHVKLFLQGPRKKQYPINALSNSPNVSLSVLIEAGLIKYELFLGKGTLLFDSCM